MTTGEQLKLDGMELAEYAKADWATEARAAIAYLAGTGMEFTCEEVTAIVGLPRPDEGSNRNNAVGAVISGCARAGVIRHTGAYRKATRPSSHASIRAIWVGV